jgi:hypothetical protein
MAYGHRDGCIDLIEGGTMRHLKRIGLMTMTMALVIGFTSAAYATETDLVPGNPVYLTLGDSWGYGQGATDPATSGYAAVLAGTLAEDLDCSPAESEIAVDGCKHLQHLNLARGATETLPGVTAPIVASEQLPIAIPMLEDRNGDINPANDVEAITLHVGGNDVTGPIQAACIRGIDATCVKVWMTEMAQFEADLQAVVGPLRSAAGDETPIVLGTYDNPVATCWLFEDFGPSAVFLGAMLLEGSPDFVDEQLGVHLDGIHEVVRRVASENGAQIAESFTTLEPGDFVGGADCLHIRDSGHQKVAATFAAILES